MPPKKGRAVAADAAVPEAKKVPPREAARCSRCNHKMTYAHHVPEVYITSIKASDKVYHRVDNKNAMDVIAKAVRQSAWYAAMIHALPVSDRFEVLLNAAFDELSAASVKHMFVLPADPEWRKETLVVAYDPVRWHSDTTGTVSLVLYREEEECGINGFERFTVPVAKLVKVSFTLADP